MITRMDDHSILQMQVYVLTELVVGHFVSKKSQRHGEGWPDLTFPLPHSYINAQQHGVNHTQGEMDIRDDVCMMSQINGCTSNGDRDQVCPLLFDGV